MDCPYCGFDKTKVVNVGFPQAFECVKCHKIFSESNPAFSEK